MACIPGLQDVDAAIRGGSVFAAGGDDPAEHGQTLGAAAVSIAEPKLESLDEVSDGAYIAAAAAIDAPAGAGEWQMLDVAGWPPFNAKAMCASQGESSRSIPAT